MDCKKFYTLSSFFIACWWLIAFHAPVANEVSAPLEVADESSSLEEEGGDAELLAIDREEVVRALRGDYPLMGELIARWDIETEIALSQGFSCLARLKRERILRSRFLTLQIERGSIGSPKNRRCLVDSNGTPFDLTEPHKKFLPQSYLAAGILLSLLPPEKIAALPRGMRAQEKIYPKEVTKGVAEDFDRFDSEKLLLLEADLAIVSERYTHPLALEILNNLGIATFALGEVNSLEQVGEAVEKLGRLTGSPERGELMALFIEAASHAIDNKRKLALSEDALERSLLLSYHTKFSLPGPGTLNRSFIERIGMGSSKELLGNRGEESFSTPVSEEEIIAFNPKRLIITTALPDEKTLSYFYTTPLFSHIDAAKERQVALLDDDLQQTISQYALLAYYDLNNALTPLKRR